MPSVIFSGNYVKALKAGINLFNNATIWSGNVDPSSSGFAANTGDVYISTLTNSIYVKSASGNTAWDLVNSQFKAAVPNAGSLPASGNTSGDVRIALDTGIAWEWNGSSWQLLNVVQLAAVGSSPNADGLSVDSTTNTINLQPADGTHPGALTALAQTIGGAKTFTSAIAAPGASLTAALNMNSNLIDNVTDPVSPQDAATKNYTDTTFIPLSQKGAANGVTPLDSSSKIPLMYLPSVVMEYQGSWNPTTNTPTLSDGTGTNGYVYYVSAAFAGPISGLNDPSMHNFQIGDLVIYSSALAAWQLVTPAAGVQSVNGSQGVVIVNAINQLTGDVTAGPASQSQSVAATIAPNAVTNSKLAQMPANTVKANITGSTANATDASLGTVTESTSDVLILSSWGDATIGSPTIQVKQSSALQDGYLSSADWSTFNSKQPAGNYITALTGDASATGPGSAALTLATVNANVGSFTLANITVNAKGLITAASSTTTGNLTDVGTDGITITNGTGAVIGTGTSISQHVADTTHNGYLASTDWNTFNSKQPAGNYITALTGDVAATGPGSVGATLATVNANTGSFGSATSIPSFTVNGKGLITAASSNNLLAASNSNGIAYYNGTQLTTATALTNGQLLIGSTGVAPVPANITQAANQGVTITNGAGSISLGTVQDIRTTASPSFTGLTVSGLTANSFLYSGTGGLLTTTTAPTNGQILIGSTGAAPVASTLTAGTGISINNNAGSITISANNSSTTDIPVTSFSAANNQSTPANITNLAFPNASVRAFTAEVSVSISATADLFEHFNIKGIQRDSDWQISYTSTGDSSGFLFSITAAGQVQYTSTNNAGFTAAAVKFRAITLPT